MQMTPTYPVELDVEPQVTGRNRLTTFFRLILAIPHLFLVGGGPNGGSISFNSSRDSDGGPEVIGGLLAAGILNIPAALAAIVSWFAILITGKHPRSFWDFQHWVLRWQTRSGAYLGLLADEYPPFGEGDYRFQIAVTYPEEPRNRLTVLFRIFMVIPHAFCLFFLGIAVAVVTVIAWFAILFTGAYPQSMYDFSVGVYRWNTRVGAYAILLRDEYPPFSFT